MTVLNVGMPNGPQTENHNPFLELLAPRPRSGYRWMIYEPLVMLNPVRPADPSKPWLATKCGVVDKDYTSVKLTIRDKVKWSDGQTMTADDVAYTYKLLQGQRRRSTRGLPISDVTVSGNGR